jgi:drug/metabolite transporter (DMT)-like permease
MEQKSLIKGVAYAALSLLFVSFQPIIANARPEELDAFLFAAATCIVEALVFFPMLIIETRVLNNRMKNEMGELSGKKNPLQSKNQPSHPFEKLKEHKLFLLYIGFNFGIAQVLFFIAYRLAGAINGSLAQQTTIIFGLIFGFLILKEKPNLIQIIFSFILLFGLIFAVTKGQFNLIQLNFGVILMLFVTALWMIAHSLSRSVFSQNKITPIQLAFIRNVISGFFLALVYLIFFPITNLALILKPINLLFMILMGIVYALDIFLWYNSIKYVEVSKATVIASPMPILTAFFAFAILGEFFTIYHFIGAFIIIASIIVIVSQKSKTPKLEH